MPATTCDRHLDTGTELGCQRCGIRICPRCMVETPVGFRCAACAAVRRLPMYQLALGDYARALGVALPLGALFGVGGALLLAPTPRGGFVVLVLALLGGAAAGRVVAAAIDLVTRGKRGRSMQVVALTALLSAGIVRLAVGGELDLVTRDVSGLVAVAAGVVVAWDRLR